jgi:hypothetical protein
LHQAVTAVDSCLDMIRGCIVHCCELEYNNKAFPYAQFIAKLKMNHANIECHRDSLLNIIEQSNGTAGLVSYLGFVVTILLKHPSYIKFWNFGMERHSNKPIKLHIPTSIS